MARSGHQDRQILRILERLNDKDTQRTASDDLMRLVKVRMCVRACKRQQLQQLVLF
jgi:hypothetical protein